MLTSLFETNKGCRIRVFLLTNGISDDNQRRLECLCKAYGNSIEICQPDSQLSQYCDIDKLNSSNWSKMIYYKLFMPHILPLEVERCLFLDVDMVVVDNLNELYNIPLNPNAIIGSSWMRPFMYVAITSCSLTNTLECSMKNSKIG